MASSKIAAEAPTVTTLKSVFGGMEIGQYSTPRGKGFCKATLWKLCFRWGANQVSHSSVTCYDLTVKLAVSLHVNFKGNVSRFISDESLKYVHEKYVKRYLHKYPEQYDLLNIVIYTILPIQLNIVLSYGKYKM